MEWVASILWLLIGLLSAYYMFCKWTFTYWKKLGVNYIEPEFFWGNTKQFAKRELSLGKQLQKFYNEFKSRGAIGGGVYFSTKPVFVPVDLDAIKNILQKDFGHFVNHGLYFNEKDDPLQAHLFNLENDKWKNMRTKLTPTFTSGKLKMMFQTLTACSVGLYDLLKSHSTVEDPVEIKDVVARFTTDVIGSCAFGLECNSLKDPESDFRRYGKRVFEPDLVDKIKVALFLSVPRMLLKTLRVTFTNKGVERFFMGVVKDTIAYREENNIYRKDFMHMMLQMKNRGKISDDGKFTVENNSGDKFTFNEVAAQCYVFFVAGYETSSSLMTFALLELARNRNIQDKLRHEIKTVLKKYNGEITYDAVMEMSYLEKVAHETLRIHPPLDFLPRECNKTYKLPGSDILIEKGVTINIPTLAIHMDPEIYPNPEKFDPERFREENRAKRHPFSLLAFGEGPRICIGARFGLMQAKVGLVAIIKDFEVTLNSKTKVPIQYVTKNFVSTVDGDVWLNTTKLS